MSEDKAQPAELRWSGEPWDQQPHEPDLWHGRFKLYLEMGPTRSVSAVERAVVEKAGKEWVEAKGRYHFAARRWYWRQRANAWDVRQRELLALSERNTRVALRDRRLERMEDYLEAICDVLDTANITEVDEKQARAWLPQMRAFLRDLLVMERQEFEHGDYERGDPNGGVTITADDLRAAQRALMAGQATAADRSPELQLHEPPAGVFTGPAPVKVYEKYLAGRTLLVCIGPDSALMLDLAALRAVRSATGLKFQRLLDATRPKFAAALRRERSFGRPVELLHLALHASPEGVEFADGVADGDWLSERLFGVRVMLLASCRGDSVGDWLGVVPHVITLSEEISHEDAAVLTQHFWHNIGLGMEPGAALDEALGHCPPAVSEYVVRHW